MRLDRFLCEMNIGTRSQVKTALRQGLVAVNGLGVRDAGLKIDELNDRVCFQGKELEYRKFVYYMLNKPAGVVSATQDNTADTVVSLLGENARKDIFPVGRLDKDTTGLLLLTNDGELAHRLLSPKRHVDKVYRVTIEHPLSESEKLELEQGVDISSNTHYEVRYISKNESVSHDKPKSCNESVLHDESVSFNESISPNEAISCHEPPYQKDSRTLPAKVKIVSESEILLTIHEGRFHQVKRMLSAVGNRVLALERVEFGGIPLDRSLEPGGYRELTKQEVDSLHEA